MREIKVGCVITVGSYTVNGERTIECNWGKNGSFEVEDAIAAAAVQGEIAEIPSGTIQVDITMMLKVMEGIRGYHPLAPRLTIDTPLRENVISPQITITAGLYNYQWKTN